MQTFEDAMVGPDCDPVGGRFISTSVAALADVGPTGAAGAIRQVFEGVAGERTNITSLLSQQHHLAAAGIGQLQRIHRRESSPSLRARDSAARVAARLPDWLSAQTPARTGKRAEQNETSGLTPASLQPVVFRAAFMRRLIPHHRI